jgi:hypothetical protein
MHELDQFLLFTQKFNELGIPFMVTGSVATILYGEPRLTHDIDIVLYIREFNAKAFNEKFPLEEFYCPPEEVLILESRRNVGGHFNIIHHETGFKADVYIATENEFYKWAFDHSQLIQIKDDISLRIAPPEYVIVNKLSFFREGGSAKHIDDIKGVIAAGTEVSWEVVRREASQRGLLSQLSLVYTFES